VDAHRLILFAAGHDREWEAADALFRAYFKEGKNLNDHEQLVELATGVGLDAGAVRGYLAGEGGAAEVVASQEEAGRLGIAGVPCYVFDGRYALSGAQPVEVLRTRHRRGGLAGLRLGDRTRRACGESV
jgi:predicted DsbA family dithiol-disulfide isomerase